MLPCKTHLDLLLVENDAAVSDFMGGAFRQTTPISAAIAPATSRKWGTVSLAGFKSFAGEEVERNTTGEMDILSLGSRNSPYKDTPMWSVTGWSQGTAPGRYLQHYPMGITGVGVTLTPHHPLLQKLPTQHGLHGWNQPVAWKWEDIPQTIFNLKYTIYI